MGGGVGGRGSVVALQPHSRGPKSGVRVRGIAGSIAAPFGMIVISGVLFVGGTQRNLSDLIASFFWGAEIGHRPDTTFMVDWEFEIYRYLQWVFTRNT